MPTRILRDGILTSERVDALDWREEVFYRRLQSVVDDHGRFYANPKLILAACFPLRVGKVSDSDILKWLTACVTAALVRVYPASDGKRYLEILDFGQRIQSKSKFPAYCGDLQDSPVENRNSPELTVKNGLVVDVVVGEVVGDISSVSTDRIPYADIVDAYHAALPMLPQVRKLTKVRKDKLRKCWLEDEERQTLAYWTQFFGYVATSDFLTGRNGRFTACDFEWLVEPSRHLKVSEGKYDNRETA